MAWSAIILETHAQTVKEELMKINQAYQDSENFYAEVIYSAMKENDETFDSDVQKGAIYKSGNFQYNKMGEIETIMQDSLQLLLDHSKDVMLLTYRKQEQGMMQISEIENALRKCVRIEQLHTAFEKGYELWLNDESCEKLIFTYDPASNFLNKMELHYKKVLLDGKEMQGVKLTMQYRYPAESQFGIVSVDNYVKKENGAYVSTASFDTYRLIDYTEIIRKTSNR